MSDLQIPFEALRDQINSAIDVIVQIDRYADGRRRVAEVAVVASHAARDVPARHASRGSRPTRSAPTARVTGRVRHFPLPPAIAPPADAGGRDGAGRVRPRGRADARPGAGGRARWHKDALALILLLGVLVLGAARASRCCSAAPPAAPSSPRAAATSGGGSAAAGARARALDMRLRRTDSGQRLARGCGRGREARRRSTSSRRGRRRRSLAERRCCAAARAAAGRASSLGYVDRRRRAALVGRAPARQAPRRVHRPAARPRAHAGQRRVGRACRSPARCRWPRASCPTRPAREMRAVVEEMRVGQPVDGRARALRERLPSREVAVLMTTIVIQQRAGGDTVRALQELGGDARRAQGPAARDPHAAVGLVFTSYVVAGIGVGTILLMNVISPGVMREMTSSLLGPAALVVAGDAVGDRVRADPARRRRWTYDVTPLLAGALAALRRRSALLAVPLLRDRGRSTGSRRAPARTPATRAALADRAAGRARWRRGSGRGWRRASALSRREALERRLDLAGRPGGLTVQRFIGAQGARSRCSGRRLRRLPGAASAARR